MRCFQRQSSLRQRYHRVRKGDTIHTIAKKYDTLWCGIYALNAEMMRYISYHDKGFEDALLGEYIQLPMKRKKNDQADQLKW